MSESDMRAWESDQTIPYKIVPLELLLSTPAIVAGLDFELANV